MQHDQDHIAEVWIMTRADEELTIELYRDGETIHVEGGNGEAYSGSRGEITNSLIPVYVLAGWTLTDNYETA
ncbi:hypothetical protein ACFWNQ_15135 [Streptomyces virginiae]|uniref:hypothetical protein n=1 Tax=Streptomyces virginiae TaxID=1961 RepID=UPI0036534BF6